VFLLYQKKIVFGATRDGTVGKKTKLSNEINMNKDVTTKRKGHGGGVSLRGAYPGAGQGRVTDHQKKNASPGEGLRGTGGKPRGKERTHEVNVNPPATKLFKGLVTHSV